MYRLMLKDGYKHLLKLKTKRTFEAPSHGLHNLPRQAGFGKVFVILTPLVAVGGVISYANYDREFRKTIESNVPGSGVVLKFVLEDKPIETISKKIENIKQKSADISSSVTSLIGTPSEKSTEIPKLKPVQEEASHTSAPKIVIKHTPAPAPQPVKIIETLPTDITGLVREIEIEASLAVQEFNKAINILNSFKNEVQKIVEKSVDDIDPKSWTALKNKTSARDSAVERAEKSAADAIKKIEKCEIALSKIATASNHEQVHEVRGKVKTLNDHINEAKEELYKSKLSSNLSEKYWKKVEESRNFFVEQIESIFPEVNISEKKLKVSEDDLDLFILHAYSHVLAYQKELQRLQTEGELRLKRAIDASRGSDQSVAVNAQLDFYLEKERRQLAIENHKKMTQIRADAEKQLRLQLKQQAEAHVDHLNDTIAIKESELKRQFNHELEEKLAKERAAYKLQLAEMLGKLRGIDAAFKARSETDKSAHQAQALWASCQALWATVRTGESGGLEKNKLHQLKSEINLLKKMAEGDELVRTVLENIPKTAEDRGIYTEDTLRERFINVEKIARKLALVPEEGARLPIYLLSYLQSLFILRPSEAISADELEDRKIDFSKLDTYDILNKARYYVERGNLMQALKYMNLLQGAPRKISSDWINETRLLLETQQAANTLMAHAATNGLLYL